MNGPVSPRRLPALLPDLNVKNFPIFGYPLNCSGIYVRKMAAIFLFGLYTFNLVGYHFVFHVLEKTAAQALQATLAKEAYADADLITITVPLSLPYISDSRRFENMDGEVTKDGKIYHAVKRAIQNGMLVLRCLPDHQKMKLERAKDDFSRLANAFQDTNSPQKKQNAKEDLAKNLNAKYPKASGDIQVQPPVCTRAAVYGQPVFQLDDGDKTRPKQPPEFNDAKQINFC